MIFDQKINEHPWIFMISQGFLGNLGNLRCRSPRYAYAQCQSGVGCGAWIDRDEVQRVDEVHVQVLPQLLHRQRAGLPIDGAPHLDTRRQRLALRVEVLEEVGA